MTVSDLLEQPCNKSDNINKVVTSWYQLVSNLLTTWDEQCEDNLLTARLATRCETFASTHVKISQLVNKMCSQQACSKLVNRL